MIERRRLSSQKPSQGATAVPPEEEFSAAMSQPGHDSSSFESVNPSALQSQSSSSNAFARFVNSKPFFYGGMAVLLGAIVLMGLQIFASENVKPSGWFAATKSSASSKAITSFQDCVDAGNPIMESYPPMCNANGQTFAQAAASSSNSSKSASTGSAAFASSSSSKATDTYQSTNYPALKIDYKTSWVVDKQNKDFPGGGSSQKDETGKTMVSAVITFTRGDYQVVFTAIPNWDFGGYGPGMACSKKDTYAKYIRGSLGRVEQYVGPNMENSIPAGFRYSYAYINGLQDASSVSSSYFNGGQPDSMISFPDPQNTYFACYVTARETGAGLILSNYTQNGKKINAAVTVHVNVRGEGRDETIFQEIDQMVFSAVNQ